MAMAVAIPMAVPHDKMAAVSLLEDTANVKFRRELVFRDCADFLAHDDDWLMCCF